MENEILTHAIAAIVGAIGGSFLTFRFTKSTDATGKGTAVDQSRSTVKGDQIGRDKINKK